MKTIVMTVAACAALATLAGLTIRADEPKPKTSPADASSLPGQAGQPDLTTARWVTDFNAALKRAHSERKSLLLDFTGSDWCGWCMKLDREIFATPEFKRYADQHLVLMKVDFPRHQAQSDAEKLQNEQLAARFQVQGFPTLVVMNPDGKALGTLGYMDGGPGPFIDKLDSLIANKP